MNEEDSTISYVRLDKQYFEENSNFVEMLDPNNPTEQNKRMYLFLSVIYENNTLLVPLRTKMIGERKFGIIGYPVPSSTRPNAGLDYRKILIVNDSKYIIPVGMESNDGVSSSQQRIIHNNYATICNQIIAYVKGYVRAAIKEREEKEPKYSFSTLRNFHNELKIIEGREKRKAKKKDKV